MDRCKNRNLLNLGVEHTDRVKNAKLMAEWNAQNKSVRINRKNYSINIGNARDRSRTYTNIKSKNTCGKIRRVYVDILELILFPNKKWLGLNYVK